jgi:hemoglobin/transferrin/lactoferrin receptor protein
MISNCIFRVFAALTGRFLGVNLGHGETSIRKRLTKLSFGALAVILTMTVGVVAKAQTDEEEIKVRSIMVTANRVLQELFELPMTVNVITAEDLEKQPYTSIYDVLSNVPGVSVQGTGNTGLAGASRVSIRGEAFGRTLIMIDGVKAIDKDKATGTILITPSQIERIEIIKGPASVLYGAEAIGGVINIITKKGGTKPVGFSQNVVLDSSTESADLTTALFGSYKGFNYRFSGNGVNVKNRKVPKGARDASGALINDGVSGSHYRNRYYSGQIGYDYDKFSISLQYDKYENETYYSLGETTLASGTTVFLFPINDRETWRGSFIANDLGPMKKLTIVGSKQNVKRDWTSIASVMVALVNSDSDQYTGSIQTEWSLGSHYLTAGVDYIRDEIQLFVDNKAGSRQLGKGTADIEQTNLGIFAQDEWKFHDNWRATFGVRQTWFKGETKGSTGNYFDGDIENERTYSDFVGSVGLVYTGIKDLALRAQWAQGTRYPTVGQLFTGTTGHFGSNTPSEPNPNLRPEKSNSYELGLRLIRGGWDVDLSLFYTIAKDFIDSMTIDGVSTYVNASKATTRGAELTASYTFLDYGLTPYVNAVTLRRQFTDRNGRKTNKTGYSPLQGTVGLKFEKDVNESMRFYSDFHVDWALKAESHMGTGDAMASADVGSGESKYEAWQNASITLGVRGGVDHKYNVSLSVRNIFDQIYSRAKGPKNLPEAGLHAVLGLGFEY